MENNQDRQKTNKDCSNTTHNGQSRNSIPKSIESDPVNPRWEHHEYYNMCIHVSITLEWVRLCFLRSKARKKANPQTSQTCCLPRMCSLSCLLNSYGSAVLQYRYLIYKAESKCIKQTYQQISDITNCTVTVNCKQTVASLVGISDFGFIRKQTTNLHGKTICMHMAVNCLQNSCTNLWLPMKIRGTSLVKNLHGSMILII